MPAESRLLIHPIRDVVIVNFIDPSILDTLQVEAIGKELFELVDQRNHRKIILDFQNVKFLSSSALGVLITMKKKADAIKGKVVICSMKPDLKKVFKITKLDKMFEFCDNEEEGLGTFGITTAG